MNLSFLIFLLALSLLFGKVFSKLCSNTVTEGGNYAYPVYFTVNGIAACFFFYIFSGFKISLNAETVLFSIFYALVVVLSLFGSLLIYKLASIVGVNLISSAASLVSLTFIGYLLFDDELGFRNLIKIALMLVAVALVFLDARGKAPKHLGNLPKSNFKLLLLVIFITVLSACFNVIILKYFSLSKSVTDENSFFFFTNVILIFGALIYIFILSLKEKNLASSIRALMKPKKLIFMTGSTICGNLNSLVGVWIIKEIALSTYTATQTAVGIISSAVASLLFREKLGLFSYLSLIVACITVII